MTKLLIALAAAAALVLAAEFFLPGLKFILRQSRTRMRLSLLPGNEYIVVNNVVPGDKSKKIDYAVVSRYGIFVIQEKPYGGRIFGESDNERWIRMSAGKEHPFRNPLMKTRAQISALRSLLNLNGDCFLPLVVFSGGGSSWAETSVPIIPGYLLRQTIKSHTEIILDYNQMQDAALKLSRLSED